MAAAENKRIVTRFIDEAFNNGNLGVVDELVAGNYVSHTAGLDDAHGPDSMKQFVTTYRTAFPDYVCTIDEQVAEGDMVVTRWTVRGTQRGPFMGLPPSGKRITLPGIVIDRMADGKLAETWLQADVLGLMQQLGAIPASERAQ